MPNWKKVIVSGSDAILNEITASGGILTSQNIMPDVDNTLSLGSSTQRFQLNGGTPVTVTGSGNTNIVARFNGATEVENSTITNTDTLTTIIHDNDGNDILIISGANGELLKVTDEIGQNLFQVNDGSGLPKFEVSSSGVLRAQDLTYNEETFVLTYNSQSGNINFFSASALVDTPTLQEVTDQGSSTTNNITIDGGSDARLTLDRNANGNDAEVVFLTNGSENWSIGTGQVGGDASFTIRGQGAANYFILDTNGDLSVTNSGSFGDLTVDDSVFASTFTGSLVRLDETGTGMRITNVGGFEPQSGAFNIFGNNNVTFGAGGSSEGNRVLTMYETSNDAHFANNVIITGSITGSSLFLGDYAENQSNRLTINNGSDATAVRAAHSTYCGVIVDYTIYSTDAGRSNQRTGTYRATFNDSEVHDNEIMTNDIGDTNGFVFSTSLDGTNFTLTANNDIGQQCRVSYTTKLIRV